MTVREAHVKHTAALQAAGIESASLECEHLLAHVLGVSRLELLIQPRINLSPAVARRLAALVRQRVCRVPLQYLEGTVSFLGLTLCVNRHVLIPRPETEILAEEAIRFFTRQAKGRALDFGTGSGCLAIALAVACPSTQIDALDISARALAVARENARGHRVAARIRFRRVDGLKGLPGRGSYHLIVANPPYICSGEIGRLQPEVRLHEPRLALDAGDDGLKFFRVLSRTAAGRLQPGGRLMLEIGDGQAPAVRELLITDRWHVNNILPDLRGTPRIVIACPA